MISSLVRRVIKRGAENFVACPVRPMQPSLYKHPFDSDDFIFELKWDGFRGIACLKDNNAYLYSRRGRSFGNLYPQLTEGIKKIKKNILLDGEIVVLDKNGKADFEGLRNYHPGKKADLRFYAFDLLYYDKYDLMELPLIKRKQILKSLIQGKSSILYSDHVDKYGIELFQEAEKEGLEGIVAKRKSSVYIPGARTKEWLKIKTEYHKDFLRKFPREF
jgi:bifunctional non-homologous end joining protein LigD